MKTGRHARILDIIAEHPIETQDELLTRLREEGFKATQATISRDIKDLRLVKTLGSDGKYRYVSAGYASFYRHGTGKYSIRAAGCHG